MVEGRTGWVRRLWALVICAGLVLSSHAIADEFADAAAAEAAAAAVAAAEAQRQAEEAARLAAEQEAQRQAAEAAQRAADEAAQRAAQEEAQRIANEEAQRAAQQEAQRIANEEAQRAAQQEAQRIGNEEAQRQAAEQSQRATEQEAQRQATEAAQRVAEEQAQRDAAAQATQRAAAEAQAQREAVEQAQRVAEEQAQREVVPEPEVTYQERAPWMQPVEPDANRDAWESLPRRDPEGYTTDEIDRAGQRAQELQTEQSQINDLQNQIDQGEQRAAELQQDITERQQNMQRRDEQNSVGNTLTRGWNRLTGQEQSQGGAVQQEVVDRSVDRLLDSVDKDEIKQGERELQRIQEQQPERQAELDNLEAGHDPGELERAQAVESLEGEGHTRQDLQDWLDGEQRMLNDSRSHPDRDDPQGEAWLNQQRQQRINELQDRINSGDYLAETPGEQPVAEVNTPRSLEDITDEISDLEHGADPNDPEAQERIEDLLNEFETRHGELSQEGAEGPGNFLTPDEVRGNVGEFWEGRGGEPIPSDSLSAFVDDVADGVLEDAENAPDQHTPDEGEEGELLSDDEIFDELMDPLGIDSPTPFLPDGMTMREWMANVEAERRAQELEDAEALFGDMDEVDNDSLDDQPLGELGVPSEGSETDMTLWGSMTTQSTDADNAERAEDAAIAVVESGAVSAAVMNAQSAMDTAEGQAATSWSTMAADATEGMFTTGLVQAAGTFGTVAGQNAASDLFDSGHDDHGEDHHDEEEEPDVIAGAGTVKPPSSGGRDRDDDRHHDDHDDDRDRDDDKDRDDDLHDGDGHHDREDDPEMDEITIVTTGTIGWTDENGVTHTETHTETTTQWVPAEPSGQSSGSGASSSGQTYVK